MNKTPILVLLVLFFSGCKALSDLTKIDLPINQTVTVPKGIPPLTEASIQSPEVNTGIESVLSSYNASPDVVQSVTFKELKITSVSGVDLGYLKKIEIWISADDLPLKKIAWIDQIAAHPGATLNMNITSDDLKPYILKEKFSMLLKVTTSQLQTEDQSLNINMKFVLDLKILGL